ncbi:MAG: SagB/ThcOx family dehydrogenase [Thaumarchaeota archaeon]|nr:SagB/ThcOx family dehydrogenase [Nitrososphaerota archaeon]
MSGRQCNNETQIVSKYHEATKHSEFSVKISGHRLDVANKPSPFKIYQVDLATIPLPRDFPEPKAHALEALVSRSSGAPREDIDLETVAELLFFCAGLTRKMRIGGEVYYMRAASATGALYPIELYLVCRDLPGLDAGVYHFAPGDFTLTQLRSGDYIRELSSLAGDNEDILSAPLTIVFTSLAWRNAWKYEARSYRHWFWDSGVIAANLLATCNSEKLSACLVTGFVDKEIDSLLGLEVRKEATIALLPLGGGREYFPLTDNLQIGRTLSNLYLKTNPLSQEEQSYPLIWEMNEASSLSEREEVRSWTGKLAEICSRDRKSKGNSQNEIIPLQLQEDAGLQGLPLWETILRRGSTRRFARRPIPFAKLSWILHSSTRGVPLTDTSMIQSNEIYLIANAVDGLSSGSYYYDHAKESLELLKLGNFRNVSAYLCLEQPLFGDASAVLFTMVDLPFLLRALGNRGYRVAQLEAGIVAGKTYLSSYSLKLGASGSTFYDDAVTEFFSPHASANSAMIAIGVGIPDYKARPGGILVGKARKTTANASTKLVV